VISGKVVMRAVGITKTYGGTQALKGVDFEIREGTVTVLFGENGAGKSTLMKILSGVEAPSAGSVELDGEPITLRDTVDATRRGISIIHQELNLCPNLSVRDNIFMGRDKLAGFGTIIDRRSENTATLGLLERLEEDLSPDRLVSDLRLGQQQVVEIARALAGNARVLIMDEPTSALSGSEVEVLFRLIRELTATGVAIVYISHHLEEALEIADQVVIFRDGELVAKDEADNVNLNWIISKMVGRDGDDLAPELNSEFGDVALSLRGIKVADPTNSARMSVDGLSLDVRRGEVVCLYGLMGAGRTELLEALAGRLTILAGAVELQGRLITNESIQQRIALGLTLVPEDRQRDGLIQTMSVGNNLTLANLKSLVRGLWLSAKVEGAAVQSSVREMRVKTASTAAPITSLSGGNQQKVVIGKVLLTDPEVLLLDEPTRGIDVGVKAQIFTLIDREARKGLAVLFATSEVGEALHAANRVIVMSKGHIVAEFDGLTVTREQLMGASGESVDAGKELAE
jgi:erythritol transport system ATP-binding protein